MVAELDFCLLGPLRLRHRGLAVTVPPGKQQVVLAALLLNAGDIACGAAETPL